MTVVASQLVAKVSTEGVSGTKDELKSVGQTASETSGNLKSMLGNALSFAAGQAVFNMVGQAVGFLKDQVGDLFQKTFDAQNVFAQTVQVLQSTGDASGETTQSIKDLADSLAQTTDFADTVTESGENMLLTFTNIGQDVFPTATKTMLDMSQALGQDVKSSAIQLGKALNDPITGITALSRVGVTFTDDQKNMIQSMMDAGDVAGAQAVILKELQREFGGSAEAVGKTFPGQLQILQNRLDETKEKIGTALLPVLQGFTSYIDTTVMPIVDRFSDWFTTTAVPALQHFADYLQNTAIPAVQHVATWIDTMAHNSQVAIPVLTALGAMVATVLVPAFASWAIEVATATWPILAIAGAVAGLTAIFMALWNNNAGFRSFIQGLGKDFQQLWTGLQQNFLPVMQQIGSGFMTYVMPFLQAIGSFVASQFIPVWQRLTQLWNEQFVPMFQRLMPAFQQMLPLLQVLGAIIGGVIVVSLGMLMGVIEGLVKGVAYMVEGLGKALGGIMQMFTGLVEFIGGVIHLIVDIIHGNWSGVLKDLQQIGKGIVDEFQGLWNTVLGVLEAAWGLISGFLGGFVTGFLSFFQHLADELVHHSIIPDMINEIINWIASLPGRAFAFIENMVSGAIARFNQFKEAAIVIFEHLVGQIIGAFSGIGSGIWSGVKSGLNNAIGLLNSWIGGLNKIQINVGDFHAGFDVPTIPYLAKGGNITQGGWSVVGDQGPELAYMPAGARVVPLSGGSSGGMPIQVVVQLTNETSIDGYRLAGQLMPHIVRQIRTATGTRF